MKIKIVNAGNRNQLICFRQNGSVEKADLGPVTPFHDLAHFVVEKQLGLEYGFYGNIKRGFTVDALSDKEIIKTLPEESMVSEIVTRALQSLYSGAVSVDQFSNLVAAEFKTLSIHFDFHFTEKIIFQLFVQYDELITRWTEMKEGESIDLDF